MAVKTEGEQLDLHSRRQAPVAQTEYSLMADFTDVEPSPNHMTCE